MILLAILAGVVGGIVGAIGALAWQRRADSRARAATVSFGEVAADAIERRIDAHFRYLAERA